MEVYVKVVLQIKDISVFVFRASPQLIVKKGIGNSTVTWSIISKNYLMFNTFPLL